MQWRSEILVFLMAGAMPLGLALLLLFRVRGATARALAQMLIAQSLWGFGQSLELLAVGLNAKLCLDGLQYIPACWMGYAGLLFAMRYTGARVPVWFAPAYVLACGPGLLTLATAPFHRHGRADAHVVTGEPFLSLRYSFHAIDYFLTLIIVVSMALASLLLLRHITHVHRVYLKGGLLVLVGVSAPLLSLPVIAALDLSVYGQRDLSFVVFALAALPLWGGTLLRRPLALGVLAQDTVFELGPDAALVLGDDDTVLDVNRAAGNLLLTGDVAACLGRPLNDVLRSDLSMVEVLKGPAAKATILPEVGSRHFEASWFRTPDESARVLLVRDVTRLREAELSLRKHKEELESRVLQSTISLRESARSLRLSEGRRHHVEERLAQVDKMDALGRLAGGVAHDFNNQLTVILGNTDLLLESCETELDRQILGETRKAALSAAALTQQLLTLGQKSLTTARTLNAQEGLRTLESMLRRLMREDIRIEVSFDEGLWNVRMEAAQFQQVMINLALNARDAMPEGGLLNLSARNGCAALPDDPKVMRDWVIVEVRDTGEGIPRDRLGRIFEPFYTTKGLGKGTGLGLSMVYSVLRQQGGFCEVTSELGQGTCFQIYFPRSLETQETLTQEPGTHRSSTQLEGRVVVVEDEDSVRALESRVLQSMGLQVLGFASAEELLACCPAIGRPHLLISDIVMPGLSGIDLANRLEKIWPGLNVMLVSGYSDDQRLLRAMSRGTRVLTKPFSAELLRETVQRRLNQPQAWIPLESTKEEGLDDTF